jgi:hypothetical protein
MSRSYNYSPSCRLHGGSATVLGLLLLYRAENHQSVGRSGAVTSGQNYAHDETGR